MHAILFPERAQSDFDTSFLDPFVSSNTDHPRWKGAAVTQASELSVDTAGKPLDAAKKETAVRLMILRTACANAVQAQKLAEQSPAAAWPYVVDAAFWTGAVSGRISVASSRRRSVQANEVRYAKHADAQQFVRQEWLRDFASYPSKQDFARIYRNLVLSQLNVKVTERQIREVWLKGLPAAGRPAGS